MAPPSNKTGFDEIDGLEHPDTVAVAIEDGGETGLLRSKPGMTWHSALPFNGEFGPHCLDASITPTERHFVRNNGSLPERARTQDATGWTLTIDGEVERPLRLSLDDLRAMPSVTLPVVLECAGNGRVLFDPPIVGTPWQLGAVACSEWTGVPLAHLLELAGVRNGAVYTAHYGEDEGVFSDESFSRGIPIEKARDEHTLVAWAMNGEPLPPLHGFPARLIVPGWIGSCSQKWLSRIELRDREHDAKKMIGYSYRVPRNPVAPGQVPPESEMEVATSLPVKSLITRPAADSRHPVGEPLVVAGHAWAGDGRVERVRVSLDRGIRWTEAELSPPAHRYAWARWQVELEPPGPGFYEIWAQAVDGEGRAQPFEAHWNPQGYMCNAVHRLPITIDAP